VEDWFKPIAYALILLRKDGYPCIFYGDYYGAEGDNPVPSKKYLLDPLLMARKDFDYGEQGIKNICLGKAASGKSFYDITGNRKEIITLDEEGTADLLVQGGSVSVWVVKK
jgi:alpha-amylase